MISTGTTLIEILSFFVLCHSHKITLAGLSKTKQKIYEKVTLSHGNNQYDYTQIQRII